jgi:outer membrane lipoprotein-sorting protein
MAFLVQADDRKPLQLETLMEMLAGAPTGSVRFTERKTIALLKKPLQLSGTLEFQKPSHLEKHIVSPYQQRYVVDGNDVSIDEPAKNLHQRLSLSDYPGLQAFVESIRAPLAGDLATLQRYYRVSLGGSSKNWLLALVPSDPEMTKLVRSVWVRGSEDRMREIEIEEVNGDRSVMTIELAP